MHSVAFPFFGAVCPISSRVAKPAALAVSIRNTVDIKKTYQIHTAPIVLLGSLESHLLH